MSVSIFVPPNRTIGCYTGAILPPSLPFNLSNYTFTPFIPLFPEASSGCPGVWHFPWVSDEGGLVWAKSRHFAWFMSACCHASVTQTQDKAAAPFYTCVCDWVGVFPEGFHCVFVCVSQNNPNSSQAPIFCTKEVMPTFEKRQRRSGQVRLVRSCAGCPTDCFLIRYIWRKNSLKKKQTLWVTGQGNKLKYILFVAVLH